MFLDENTREKGVKMKKILLLICLIFAFPAFSSTLEDDYKELSAELAFLKIKTAANLNILAPYIEKGNSVAMFLAAQMYESGELITKDEKKAFALYLKSAEKNPEAQFAVANMYMSGKGDEISLEKALEYYTKAFVNGDEKLKTLAEERIAQIKEIQKKELILKEMEAKALSAEPQAMLGLSEFCLSQGNVICAYVWLSLSRQMKAFEKTYSELDKAILQLTGSMTMAQLTQAEEEISTLEKILPKE